MSLKSSIVLILTLLFLHPVKSYGDEINKSDNGINDTTAAHGSIPKDMYLFFGVGGQYFSDSLYYGNIGNFYLGQNIISNEISFEYHIKFVNLINFRARRKTYRLAFTPFIQMFGYGFSQIIGRVFSDSTTTNKYIAPLLYLPFGTHLNIRPDYHFSIYGGMSTDYLFFTDDDGILFHYKVGARIHIGKSAFVLAIEGAKTDFWGWDQGDKKFGWGVGLYLLLDPRYGYKD